MRTIEIVLARYQESLHWMPDFLMALKPAQDQWTEKRLEKGLKPTQQLLFVTIYNKGDAITESQQVHLCQSGIPINIRVRPNLDPGSPYHGGDAETWLHHFATAWHSVADLTICIQGDPFPHCTNLEPRLIDLLLSDEWEDFLPLAHWIATDNEFGQPNHNQRLLPVGEIYNALFKRPAPQTYTFPAGQQFAVTKQAVQSKPAGWYQMALSEARRIEPSCYPYCVERLWPLIFGDTA